MNINGLVFDDTEIARIAEAMMVAVANARDEDGKATLVPVSPGSAIDNAQMAISFLLRDSAIHQQAHQQGLAAHIKEIGNA